MNNATRIITHGHWIRKTNSPNCVGSKPHEHIPFLLVSDGSVSLGNFVRVHQFLKAHKGFVVWVDRLGEGQIPCGVFVTGVDEGRVRERAQIGQRYVHLRAIPFEESATATSKERIPGEDYRGSIRKGPIRRVVADGILSVTWGPQAPLPTMSNPSAS